MTTILTEKFSSAMPALIRISREAGRAILQIYDSDFAVEQKADRSPLTLADKRSHEVIAQGLSLISDFIIPILSEEGRQMPYDQRKDWHMFWLVDPLDGTKEFVKRNGEFTVNIALIQNGFPLIGVIYIPVKHIFYFAAEGLGAYKLELSNAEVPTSIEGLLKISSRLPLAPNSSDKASHLSRITVIGSRSHMSSETEQFINDLKAGYEEVDFLAAGSSLKFCLIAEGRADVYPRFGPTMEWDTAAGQAIVEQAGGRVLRAGSQEPLTYNKEDLLNPSFIVHRS